MHIAVTVGSFNQLGGIERCTVQTALGYQALGHEVTVFATKWDAVYEDRFNFIKVDAPAQPAWLRTLILPKEMSRRLAGNHYDFIHGHGTCTLTCDLLTFHSVHSMWLEISLAQEGAWSLRRLAKSIYPFHRATIAIEREQVRTHQGVFHACSLALREEAMKFYDIEPERIQAIPWAVDLEAFQPNPAIRAQWRTRWSINDDTPVLLLVANEFYRKGLATILEAMAQLGQPELQLVVVGRADPKPYLPMVERLGLKKQVRFLGQLQDDPCYQAADLFVMPTICEGWSMVIGEALASGLPVITSRFAGSSDLIVHGQNGLVLQEPRSVSELVQALHTALVPQTLLAMKAAARPSVLHNTWLQVSKQLLALGKG